MDTLRVKDVMEELRKDHYFENTHREMMSCLKNSLAYKQMQEVAVKHMFNTMKKTSNWPDAEAREEKKNQITRIGILSKHIDETVSKIVSERISREATDVAKGVLERLTNKRLECSNSFNKSGAKRKENDNSGAFQKTNEQNKRAKEGDTESEVPLDSVSEKSVSSVHTSDLSSFDDTIVLSSEDEKGVRREKRISFRTANKAFLDGGFSKMCNHIVQEKNKVSEGSKIVKSSSSNASEKSTESEDSTLRPKRARKPNLKYAAQDMYLI